jgi:DNA-binding Xre family transcriptional regulator
MLQIKKYRKTNIINNLDCGNILPHFFKIIDPISLGLIYHILKNDYTNLKEKFGQNLRRIRDNKDISLRDMAANCDLDSSQISKIENAKWDIQLSTIFELAKGLGVEAKELLDF